MVDAYLPNTSAKLRSLFVDFNAFFASVEQQERPELRGKPLAVGPYEHDSTCVIASSQEARKFGIKCGTNIGMAKRMCPDLIVVGATPQLYKAYHEALREVAQSVLPEEKVHSIDEMSYRLIGEECEERNARALAARIKSEIARRIGAYVTCSIGIAPNSFLAKIATEIEKPNGLVVLSPHDLPGRVAELRLTDLCGINTRMARRLNASMIFTVKDLYAASAKELRLAFGSIMGERWWYLLRGQEVNEQEEERKSLSHSHVLAPELRTDIGVREVLVRLLQKASARLRAEDLWATAMNVHVLGKVQSWEQHIKLPPTQDTVTLNDALFRAWEQRGFKSPLQAGVTFTNLRHAEHVTPSLFDATVERAQLNRAVDQLNGKFGKNTVYVAGMKRAKDHADEKIAFNKTWLFQEGKGDNDWSTKASELLGRT
jgi:DNA polymerase IV